MSVSVSVAAGLSMPVIFQQENKVSIVIELIKQRYPDINAEIISNLAKELNTNYHNISEHVHKCRARGIGTRETIKSLARIYKPELLQNLWNRWNRVTIRDKSNSVAILASDL